MTLVVKGTPGTSAGDIVVYDASANIGIGKTASYKLDVNGDAAFTNIWTGYGISTGDSSFELGGNRSGSGNSYIDFHSTVGSDLNKTTGAFVAVAPTNFKVTVAVFK